MFSRIRRSSIRNPCDLFGAILSRIQILMLQQDIERLQDPTFIPDGSNTVYCIFMIIGIVGYFCVPTVASWIIQAGGAGSYGDTFEAMMRLKYPFSARLW